MMFLTSQRSTIAIANRHGSVYGHRTIFMENSITQREKKTTNIMRLHLAYFMPSILVHLLSMGQILKGNLCLQGGDKSLVFIRRENDQILFKAFPNLLQNDTIY